jgi:hypothetical protein
MSRASSSPTTRRRLATVLAVAAVVTAPLLAVGLTTTSAISASNTEVAPHEPGPEDVAADVSAPKSNKPSRVPTKDVPQLAGLPVTGATGVGTRIDGLTMKDQRTSNNGNSFSNEPPDQGLCVGNGRVIEAVNNVFSIYNASSGAQLAAPQSFAPFFDNGRAEVVRHPDGSATFGDFFSDPKCYYDPALNRFFMTELHLGQDPSTGDFTGTSFEDIAVSKTSTPGTSSNDWFIYHLNVANDGTSGTVSHPGCPCFGDQPLIGADANGFYVTTNEFSIAGSQFNGAQIYAFDKAALASGTMKVQRIENSSLPLAEGVAYSVQPATSPTSAEWSNAANGTEFFLSALEFTGGFDNRIAVWALTNTHSLTTNTPDVHLTSRVIGSEVYGFPPKAEQKKGPVPQAVSLKFKEELIESNDDRMNQVVYANGKLWSGVNTAVKTSNRPTTAGIAYFVVTPSANSTTGVSGTMANQGYVAANGQSTIFPAIGVKSGGGAAMVFTLTGKNYFPSAAMVHLSSTGSVTSGIQVVAAGTTPDDGFTGYPAFDGAGVGRWGDYSAAVADGSGTVWVATEYIPGTFGFPQFIANWGTYVAGVTP